MTKQEQTKKNRQKDEKKLSQEKYFLFCGHILEKANYICQLCNSHAIDDMHHSKFGCFGANKDDRSLVGICRSCHSAIHDKGNKKKRERAVKIGEENWKGFCNENR